MTDKRHGKRWTTSEVLNLQREYELLNWSVQDIAAKHQRSLHSILYKLHAEGLTPSLYEATGYTGVEVSEKKTPLAKVAATKVAATKVSAKRVIEDEDEEDVMSDTDSSSDYEDDVSEYKSDDEVSVDCNMNTLSERVWSLETSVGQINSMVKQMFDQMSVQKKTKKLAPLRKSSTF
jgi:hypothetical protein